MQAALINLLAAVAATVGAALALVACRRARAVSPASAPRPLRRLVAPIAVHLRPTDRGELDQLTQRLTHGGRCDRDAVDRYLEERVLALFAGCAAALAWASAVRGGTGALLAAGSLVVGVIGPGKLLALRAAERRDAISAALPGAIDLLTTCVDAGLSLEHAIARVGRELGVAAPVLAAELVMTASEMDAGIASADALRRLARRSGLDELCALCGVLAQAHRLGAPIGDTLRDFASSSRRARTSLLEERAGKLAAQLTIPLAVCLLPSALLVMLGPAVLQLIRALH